MACQSRDLYKPEHSGHHRDCVVVYFYESTNIRGHMLINNFVDLPIPSPNGGCDCSGSSLGSPEDKATASSPEPLTLPPTSESSLLDEAAFQCNEGPTNQLEWLADIALNNCCPLPTPPPSSAASPKAPAVTVSPDPAPAPAPTINQSKLSQRKTPRPADSALPVETPIETKLRQLTSKDQNFTFWRYRDLSTLQLGMAESMNAPDLHAPMKRQKRKIQNPAQEGSSYYYVWRATDSKNI